MKKLEFLEKKLLEQVAEYKSTGKFSEYNDSLVARGGEEIVSQAFLLLTWYFFIPDVY